MYGGHDRVICDGFKASYPGGWMERIGGHPCKWSGQPLNNKKDCPGFRGKMYTEKEIYKTLGLELEKGTDRIDILY